MIGKWQFQDGQLVNGAYAIEWVKRGDERAFELSKRGEMIDLFPDDTGNLWRVMEAAADDARGVAL